MTNIKLASIDQYVDVSSHNNYHTFHLKDSVEKRMERIHASSRDSARTPMQWDDSKMPDLRPVSHGFTSIRITERSMLRQKKSNRSVF